MSYQISSDRFEDPKIPELLKILSTYFQDQEVPFYVVGAAARDIVLGQIYNRRSRRRTNDLDIAIMICDWNIFEKIAIGLSNLPGFSKSTSQKQRFHFQNRLMLDVIPFGEVARSDRNIYWPPDKTPVMSVTGFSEMAKAALVATIDGEFSIGVASLPGILLLKLAAWRDRGIVTNKDADDIAHLIDEYLEVNIARCAAEHSDIFERDDFNTFMAGAMLIGRDLKGVLAKDRDVIVEFAKIIEVEIGKKEGSLLINQILETHPLKKYDEVYMALKMMSDELIHYPRW